MTMSEPIHCSPSRLVLNHQITESTNFPTLLAVRGLGLMNQICPLETLRLGSLVRGLTQLLE